MSPKHIMIPTHKNRSPEQIIEEKKCFDSVGRIYKSLSWLDYAQKNENISSLEYAALETRLGIEQLLFEQLIVGVGTELDQKEYKKCKGNAKKLDQIINGLIPRYEKLVDFTIALAPAKISIAKWDNRKLIELSGKVSRYLHWSGGLDTTVMSKKWFANGISIVNEATDYIWGILTTAKTAVMPIDGLEPEIKELWMLFEADKISIDSVVKRAEILEPILENRTEKRL